jgi:hypothetical protein
MKTFAIEKKRDGQSYKYAAQLRAENFEAAKKEFRKMMLSELYEQEDGTILDECDNEVWGFGREDITFKEDVHTWKLLTYEETQELYPEIIY